MPQTADRQLLFSQLCAGLPRLSSSMAAVLAEAASVCFKQNNHTNSIAMDVKGDQEKVYHVFWLEVTEEMLSTYNDTDDAAEWGACGIAILLVLDLTNFTVVQRSKKGTGFDYWLGSKDDPLFQNKARLEVSGLFNGSDSRVKARINEKLKQTDASDSANLPAYVIVVNFGKPIAHMVKK